MLTCNLIGGLGNKMFQIATTYSLSLDNNDECIFEFSEQANAHQNMTTYIDNIFRNINFGVSNCDLIYREPHFHYSKIPYMDNLRLLGYFQSEKYFSKHREQILKLFSIDSINKQLISKKYNSLFEHKTCSLHVRRGDYLGLPNHHPICDIGYYKEAMEQIDENVVYLVFSNDIEWCKNNFIGNNFIFITGESDYIDMWLMSLCNHNIIANSSFSWWGAWLNKNQNKKVIYPKKWFGSALNHNTNDLIPEGWIII
jgi:hypothetical protein